MKNKHSRWGGQNTYKLNPNKKKVLSIVFLSLFSIALVSFGTYAIWNSELLTSNNTISSGEVKMSYTETNEISISNALPIKDEEGKLLTDYFDFQVLSYIKTKANDDTKRKINYNIILEPISVENALSDSEIKVYLTKVESGVETMVVEPTTIDQLSNYILNSQDEIFSNNKGEVITSYRLRAWIDKDVDTNKLNEKTYSYKFRVNVNSGDVSNVKPNLDTSGANAPELTSNMIPVYYDEVNDVWKKADENNADESNKWYDYDNKIWANAVTVKDNTYVGDNITYNKSVSINNISVPLKTYTTFTSGGYNINNANSMTKITVTINTAGTFGFKATASCQFTDDNLTVTVSKNGGAATTVAEAISGVDSKTYSDNAAVGDVYVITAKYAKNYSYNQFNDNGVLDSFTYPANTEVTYTDSSTAGGTSGQDWTASGETNSGISINGITYGDSIIYDENSDKYSLKNTISAEISSSLVGKYVCPTVTDTSCTTPYKIVEASNTITKVNEYKAKIVARNTYLNASSETEIPMNAINTMWVWIPRYTYTYLHTNTPQEINIKFENGTNSSGTIKCSDAVTGTSSTSETCTDSANGSLIAGTSTYTHPAFWWDKNDDSIRTEDEELTGIWVGKFEVSSDTICTAQPGSTASADSVGKGCNLQTIRPLIKPNITSWRGAQVGTFFNGIQKMSETGNQYGFATTDETHMMKNMEWGAVTYLSHSKYGINKEIAINSNSYISDFDLYIYTTGCGPQSEGSEDSGSTCNAYTTTLGQSASTTGNVYGVYDMSGGAMEYVMGNEVYSDGQQMSGSATIYNYNSEFTGVLADGTSFTGTYSFPSKRYYDKYSYGTSSTEYTRGKLGDATVEMAPTTSNASWYSDDAFFPGSANPWLERGSGGAFGFNNSHGHASPSVSSRAVISNLK